MNVGRDRQSHRAALRRDLVWSLLWQLTHEGAAAYSRDVYDAWLDGRDTCGIIFVRDYIGSRSYFTHVLNRLVVDGRATVSRASGRHPLYTAVVDDLASGAEHR
jgi:hypothetical protein